MCGRAPPDVKRCHCANVDLSACPETMQVLSTVNDDVFNMKVRYFNTTTGRDRCNRRSTWELAKTNSFEKKWLTSKRCRVSDMLSFKDSVAYFSSLLACLSALAVSKASNSFPVAAWNHALPYGQCIIPQCHRDAFCKRLAVCQQLARNDPPQTAKWTVFMNRGPIESLPSMGLPVDLPTVHSATSVWYFLKMYLSCIPVCYPACKPW